MQLASSGARAFTGRQVSRFVPGGGASPGHASRSIHITAFAPRPNIASNGSRRAEAIFKQTRNLLSRFVTHLTTPGTLRPVNVPAAARSLHSAPTRPLTIHQQLSLPARHALSRPLNAPYLPRPPTVPRNVTQVGLGLARNFSTARPIFQNLIENVPIAGRAFWEADWDVKLSAEREKMRLEKHAQKTERKARKEMQKPRTAKAKLEAVAEDARTESELDHYFPAAVLPAVTTHLFIPLAPTPTSRYPLSPSGPSTSTSRPLLPYALLAEIHSNHSVHSLRVSSLFARLDAAHVFEQPGVHCEARGDPSGLCTLLEVTFEGWDEKRVRGVLGEAGSGWCVMEEIWHGQEAAERQRMDDELENMSERSAVTLASACESPLHGGDVEIDPAQSFMLPTLDFSASFPASPPVWPTPTSPERSVLSSEPWSSTPSSVSLPLSGIEFHNAWASQVSGGHEGRHEDSMSDISSDPSSSAHGSWESVMSEDFSPRSQFSSESWFGFSSQFSERMEEPREYMF
ncbi:hypothetical protein CERSUDRAFT_117249 [Gelatoporia subvermispora B]|uniref:Uncharacterized protein n=1 Tax=Ceriporiopsis subvermispora (strain B) TaxID=914234 RepID=M2R676_CERS8|nr:hypothetical protein CERSUDRAFT_117249 [Gelatoporia subvermispora B]